MNYVVCDDCFKLEHRGRFALEEKTCSHGWWTGFGEKPFCIRCGATFEKDRPLHCLGSIEENPHTHEREQIRREQETVRAHYQKLVENEVILAANVQFNGRRCEVTVTLCPHALEVPIHFLVAPE